MLHLICLLEFLFLCLDRSTFNRAFIRKTCDGSLRVPCNRKLSQDERVAGVATDEAGKHNLLVRLQDKPDGVWEDK